jgi:hypothetical protein
MNTADWVRAAWWAALKASVAVTPGTCWAGQVVAALAVSSAPSGCPVFRAGAPADTAAGRLARKFHRNAELKLVDG